MQLNCRKSWRSASPVNARQCCHRASPVSSYQFPRPPTRCHAENHSSAHAQPESTPSPFRSPKHAYGGPEPFGTGSGLLRWEREAGSLLTTYLRAERGKDWKRLRHRLLLNGPSPDDTQQLGPQRTEQIERMRLKIRFRKFWDLMNERDRPWHFNEILHLCTELSPYTCERYSILTAGTMQGILSQRAQAEKAVREERGGAEQLQRRITRAARQMLYSGFPLSEERLSQLRRLMEQVSAGAGIARWRLERLQLAAARTYKDWEYVEHAKALYPLLEEAKLVTDLARRRMLPQVERLQEELIHFQDTVVGDGRLSRDELIRFREELRNRPLSCTAPDGWPQLTPDEQVPWRYPPREYQRPKQPEWMAWENNEEWRVGRGGAGDDRSGRRRRTGVMDRWGPQPGSGGAAPAGSGSAGQWGREEGGPQQRREGVVKGWEGGTAVPAGAVRDGMGDGSSRYSRATYGSGRDEDAVMSLVMGSFGGAEEGSLAWGLVDEQEEGPEAMEADRGYTPGGVGFGCRPLPGLFD